jgi:hypothetical protein
MNQDKNSVYRCCLDKEKGDCSYVYKNQYGVACCGIDGIIQVEYYGCIPNVVIRKHRGEA